jgi:cell wall-associated NlpC family hydrolase
VESYKVYKVKIQMKKYLTYILIIVALVGFSSPVFNVKAEPCESPDYPEGCTPASTGTNYQLLAPLPDPDNNGAPLENFVIDDSALGKYLNLLIQLVIGISGVLAVVMIVMGGIEYMGSELISSKEAGKDKIQNALFGLLIALGAWALLNTINGDLLNSDVKIDQATVTIDLGGESSAPFIPISPTSLQGLGISCPGSGGKVNVASIGQQFIGKSTYSQTARNTFSSSTVYLDCSSFAAQVYKCAGLANPGGTTEAMFSNGAKAVNGSTFDFTTLHPGDLVGWRPGDDKNKNGHVMIYLGNGKVLHASSPAGGVSIGDLESFKKRITYVKWS